MPARPYRRSPSGPTFPLQNLSHIIPHSRGTDVGLGLAAYRFVIAGKGDVSFRPGLTKAFAGIGANWSIGAHTGLEKDALVMGQDDELLWDEVAGLENTESTLKQKASKRLGGDSN
jgi:hypothetical protein